MNLRTVRLVLAKEMRETLRDRRTLMMMLVVPIFLYPALLVTMEQLAVFGQRRLESQPAAVAVTGGGDDLAAFLAADSGLAVTRSDSVPYGALRAAEVDAALIVEADGTDGGPAGRVRVLYDGTRDPSIRARDLLGRRLEAWGDTVLARRLAARGLPPAFAAPVAVADSSVASAEEMGGYALGRFLPMILVLMTLLGTFYPAVDLSAGEKERGTLETLMTAPVPAGEIVAGKFLAVVAVALAAAALNLASMLLTFQFAAFRYAQGAGVRFALPAGTVALVLVLLVPLAVLFAAVFLGVALRAQSFKEAQNALTPVQLAAILPMSLPMVPGLDFSYTVALVPVGGMAVLIRDLMGGGPPPGPALVAVGATAAYALLALRYAARSFGREEVLFGSGAAEEGLSWRDRLARRADARRATPRPAEALALVALVGLLYFYLGVRLQIASVERGLVVSQYLFLALPALLFVRLGPFRARESLALRAPSPRSLAAALLVILGGIPVGWLIGWAQSFFIRIPEEYLLGLEGLLTADDPRRFLWLVFLVALTPAICEELVFRGVLLHGLASEMPARRAVVLSAVVFGAFHLSLETVVRFLPTAWLGALLALVVWRTRSLLAGTLMHFVNNASILVLVALPGLQGVVTGPGGEPRWLAVGVGFLLLAAGVRLLPAGEAEGAPVTPPAARGTAA